MVYFMKDFFTRYNGQLAGLLSVLLIVGGSIRVLQTQLTTSHFPACHAISKAVTAQPSRCLSMQAMPIQDKASPVSLVLSPVRR